MPTESAMDEALFAQALKYGRPDNIKRLFPNSQALIVSGKFIDLAMRDKGAAMALAANGRNHLIIRGVLSAAQKANAAIIIEIARSESGYCPVNYWNIARQVDAICNELDIRVPVAVHADHYTIKSQSDIELAVTELPTMFEAGITSIAIDASHLPDDQNLKANIRLAQLVPSWAGLESEIGEIKGKFGLSSAQEALFLIQGLNAHRIYPNWVALNNGSVHGIESAGPGIHVELTAQIHEALKPYHVAGAQHGTSGNSLARLRAIAAQTRTTKANVATALQMIAWGVEVNQNGNAVMDGDGRFKKINGKGVTQALWNEMTAYADRHGFNAGDYRKLNLPFETKLLSQPASVRERVQKGVEEYVDRLLELFNARDTAPMVIEAICRAQSADPGPVAQQVEDPRQWTDEQIARRASAICSDKGPQGDFDD
ncbi:MAG: class II fructose-bisphosphate aldolase [Desulfobacteraceae bacterium]|jgi:fructose/tagatose bisphosphate aldolase